MGRAQWATRWTQRARTSQALHSTVSSSQDDSEWKQHQQQRASMSCGRRVVHHLVAATLVAHWPHHGGASLPFPLAKTSEEVQPAQPRRGLEGEEAPWLN